MALVNDLVEAKHGNQLSRALGRWSRYELIVIDELGYVPLAPSCSFRSLRIVLKRRP